MHGLTELIQPFMERRAALGAAVALIRGGELEYLGGFGTTSVEATGIAVTPATLFAYGSICKTICATLVMRLVERGLLHLDTPVIAYLPGFRFSDPDHGPRVTLRHVLSHTTGLPMAGKYWGPRDPDSLRRFVYEQLPHYAFLSPPGAVHLYSNTVFCLAGYLAEVVTGRYYDDLVQEYVLDPLGMRGVTFDPAVAMTYPVALPHESGPDGELRVLHRMTYNVSGNPSSFALGSVADLANLALMYLHQGRFEGQPFLTAASVAAMHAEQASRQITSAASAWAHVNRGYGLGFNVGSYRGRRAARHGGMNLTYNCFFDLLPDDQAGVVLLTNQCDDAVLLELVALLYDYALDMPHQGAVYHDRPTAVPPLTSEELRRYTGTYLSVETGDLLTFDIVDGALVLQAQGQAGELVPIGGGEFYQDVSPTYRRPIAFVAGTDGRVAHALVDGEPYHPLRRDESYRPDHARLQAYEGMYKDPSNRNRDEIYTVRVRDGSLVIAEGAQEHRCTAIAEGRFVSGLGLLEFEPTDGAALQVLVSGRATRYYPLDVATYRERRVIRYLTAGVSE
jgi:CubicO group peptidase (beta-lactamase class C family)